VVQNPEPDLEAFDCGVVYFELILRTKRAGLEMSCEDRGVVN